MMTDEPGGFARVLETLTAERRKDAGSPVLEAAFVNYLGYAAIQSADTKSGIGLMQLNVDAHPTSSNAWDSLGDAYLADGRRGEAAEAAEKALALVGSDPAESPQSRKLIRESAHGDQLKPSPTPK